MIPFVELPNGGVGKNFSLKLEFKTTKKEGILFSASSNKLHDALALEMRFGKVYSYKCVELSKYFFSIQ